MTKRKPKYDPELVREALSTPFLFRWMAQDCQVSWMSVTIGQKARASTELRKRGITPEFSAQANCVAQIWAVGQQREMVGWDLNDMLDMTELDYMRAITVDDPAAQEVLVDVEVTDAEIQTPGEGWDPEA